jgi:hypothetical protein
MPISDAQRRRGQARMQELAAEAETERQALADEIIAGLGRPATALDRIAIESIVSAAVSARQLRAQGRNDLEQQRLIAQLLRATGLRPHKPAPPKQEDFTAEMLRLATPPQGARQGADTPEGVVLTPAPATARARLARRMRGVLHDARRIRPNHRALTQINDPFLAGTP